MPVSENKLVVQQFVDRFMNGGDAAVGRALVASDFIEHERTPVPVRGPEGLVELFGRLRAAFPDLRFGVQDVIAEGDRVVCRMRFSGTQRGPFAGHAPSGRTATVDVIDIFRVVDGRIAEHWGVLDHLGLLQQLGARPTVPPEA